MDSRLYRSTFFLLLATAVFMAPAVRAQVCQGNVELITQAEVDAFDCVQVTGGLQIGNEETESDITNLDGLSELTTLGHTLQLVNNPSLTTLDGLTSLSSFNEGLGGGVLTISNNDALTSLNGLNGISHAIEVVIADNATLTNIAGLSGIETIDEGGLRIRDNPSLESIDGLSSLRRVFQGATLPPFSIHNNDALTTISGLNSLTRVPALSITDNDALTTIEGFENLTSIGEGALNISHNDALTSINGFTSLSSASGVSLNSNESLVNIYGFASLTSSAFGISIFDNDALLNLDGFASLTFSGSIEVVNNASLTNVDGLAGVTTVIEFLDVHSNPLLGSCTVGLGDLLVNGDVANIAIHSNAPGCNSICEVLEACPVDAEEDATLTTTGLTAPFPNPTTGAATLTYTLTEPTTVRLTLYDALGRRVWMLAEGPHAAGTHEADIAAGLPAGTYLLRFEAGGETWAERLTVVR